MPSIFYWFIASFIVSLGGIVAAVILVIAQNRKKKYISENIEQVYVKGTRKISSKVKGMAHYFVEFVARNGATFQLKVKQRLYDELYVNDIGSLVHRRNKILFFEKKKTINPMFFKSTKSSSRTMQVTMSSPRFKLEIQNKDEVYATIDEVMKYLDRILENKKDNFLTLEDEFGNYLEISGSDQDMLDLRYLQSKKSYHLNKVRIEEVKAIVKKFFDKLNLVESNLFQPEQ